MLENKGPASDAWTAPLSALSGLLLLLLQKSCALLPPKLYSTTKTPKPHYLSYRASYSSCSRPTHSTLPPKLQNPIICSIRRPESLLLLQKSSALLTLKLCGHHNQCAQYLLLPGKNYYKTHYHFVVLVQHRLFLKGMYAIVDMLAIFSCCEKSISVYYLGSILLPLFCVRRVIIKTNPSSCRSFTGQFHSYKI